MIFSCNTETKEKYQLNGSDLKLQILNQNREPVVGAVEVDMFPNPETPPISHHYPIDVDGYVELPDEITTVLTLIRAMPSHTCRQTVIQHPSDGDIILCKDIVSVGTQPWIDFLLKSLPRNDAAPARKIKIGVLDVVPPQHTFGDHVVRLNSEGEVLDPAYGMEHSHGEKVVEIIQTFEKALGLDFEIYMVDTHYDGDKSGMFFDVNKIAAGVELLADDYNVDIINLSGGIHPEEATDPFQTQQLLDAAEIAEMHGAVLLCAVGNNRGMSVAAPARSDAAIGVGAIGCKVMCPEGTYAERECALANHQGIFIDHDELGSVFHYYHSAIGPGLDVVAPGVGLPLVLKDGTARELFGTSFACPCASAVLATYLSFEEDYEMLDFDDRPAFGRRLLIKSCVDLGDPRLGYGVPVIKELSIID